MIPDRYVSGVETRFYRKIRKSGPAMEIASISLPRKLEFLLLAAACRGEVSLGKTARSAGIYGLCVC